MMTSIKPLNKNLNKKKNKNYQKSQQNLNKNLKNKLLWWGILRFKYFGWKMESYRLWNWSKKSRWMRFTIWKRRFNKWNRIIQNWKRLVGWIIRLPIIWKRLKVRIRIVLGVRHLLLPMAFIWRKLRKCRGVDRNNHICLNLRILTKICCRVIPIVTENYLKIKSE